MECSVTNHIDAPVTTHAGQYQLWRTHSCVQRSHSCERFYASDS